MIILSGNLESIVACGPSKTESESKDIAGPCCTKSEKGSLSHWARWTNGIWWHLENIILYFSSHILMLKLYSSYYSITAVQNPKESFYLKVKRTFKKLF